MANIQIQNQNAGRRKLRPTVDFTPMVDLGFLLITFFMFTTTMADPRRIEINMPYKPAPNEVTAFPDTSTITLVLHKNHRILYYCGAFREEFITSDFQDIRSVIIQKKKEASMLPATFSADAHNLHIIIKPHESATYQDLISIVDEMLINDITLYAIVDLTDYENSVIKMP